MPGSLDLGQIPLSIAFRERKCSGIRLLGHRIVHRDLFPVRLPRVKEAGHAYIYSQATFRPIQVSGISSWIMLVMKTYNIAVLLVDCQLYSWYLGR